MAEEKHMGVLDWFYVILQNMFICLRVLGLIDYSWWKVFSPSFIIIGLGLLGIIINGILATVVEKAEKDE